MGNNMEVATKSKGVSVEEYCGCGCADGNHRGITPSWTIRSEPAHSILARRTRSSSRRMRTRAASPEAARARAARARAARARAAS